MSIEVPQRGQPIDYNYIYKIVDQINNLTASVASRSVNSQFNNALNNATTVRTSNMIFDAGYYDVTKLSIADTTTSEKTVTYTFTAQFKYPPIVTVTPVAQDSQPASKNVSVVVTSVSNQTATITVRFNSTVTNANVGLNIIAIGVPAIVN